MSADNVACTSGCARHIWRLKCPLLLGKTFLFPALSCLTSSATDVYFCIVRTLTVVEVISRVPTKLELPICSSDSDIESKFTSPSHFLLT